MLKLDGELTIWRCRSGGLVHHVRRYDTGERSWINVACWSPYGALTGKDVYESHAPEDELVTCLRLSLIHI